MLFYPNRLRNLYRKSGRLCYTNSVRDSPPETNVVAERDGQLLGYMLSDYRNLPAARRFLRKVIACRGVPA